MARIISLNAIVRQAAARVEKETGNDIRDFLYNVKDDAVRDWTDDDGCLDYEMVIEEIENNADIYIDFIRENYPDEIREGVKQ